MALSKQVAPVCLFVCFMGVVCLSVVILGVVLLCFFLFFLFSSFVSVECINIRAWKLHHGQMLLPSKS